MGLVITDRVSAADQFAALVVSAGYTKTVTFGAAISTGTFSLAGGAIAQPAAGTDLTVTDSFTWTGGTLNSTLNEATVNLLGATATAASSIPLVTGSHFNLDIGATATFTDSTLTFTTRAGITVGADSTLIMTGMLLTSSYAGDDAKPITVTENSEDPISGKGTARIRDTNGGPKKGLLVTGGTAFIEGTVKFGGNVAPSTSVAMTKGAIVIENGGTLDTLGKEMVIEGGKLATKAVAAQGAQLDATIKAKSVSVKGATTEIVLGDTSYNPQGVVGHQFSKLVVQVENGSGDGFWLNEAVFRPSVDGTANSTKADTLHVVGKMFVTGADVKLAPVLLNNPAGGAAGRLWSIMTSTEDISLLGTPAANPPKPGFQGPAGVWQLVDLAAKDWKIKNV